MKSPAINDWQLEQYLLEELPPEEMEQVRQAVLTDQSIGMRLADLERSNAEILRRYPPERMVSRINQRLRGRAASARRLNVFSWTLAPSAAALAGLLLVGLGLMILIRYSALPVSPTGDAVRVKGTASQLVVYRKTPDGPERLSERSRVTEGDILQLSYQASGRKYGVILSLDGRGAVTLHWPDQREWAGALTPGQAVPLGFAYRLDDAPRGEIFFFVTSDNPFPIRPVSDAIAGLSNAWDDGKSRVLALPPSYAQFSVALIKPEAR